MSGNEEDKSVQWFIGELSPRSYNSNSSSLSPLPSRRNDGQMEAWLAQVEGTSTSSSSPSPPSLLRRPNMLPTGAPPSTSTPPSSPVARTSDILMSHVFTPPSPIVSRAVTASPSPPKARRVGSPNSGNARAFVLPASKLSPAMYGSRFWKGTTGSHDQSGAASLLVDNDSPPPGCSKIDFPRPSCPVPLPGMPGYNRDSDPFYKTIDKIVGPWKRSLTPDGSDSITGGLGRQRTLLKPCSPSRKSGGGGASGGAQNLKLSPERMIKGDGSQQGKFVSPSPGFTSLDLEVEMAAKARNVDGDGDQQNKPVKLETFGPSWSPADKEAWLESMRKIDPSCSKSARNISKTRTSENLKEPGNLRKKKNSSSSDTSTDVITPTADMECSQDDKDERDDHQNDNENTARSDL